MQLINRIRIAGFISLLLLSHPSMGSSHPDDPYESINREIYKFNTAFDATVTKPISKAYKAVIPPPVRTGIDNAYNNLNLLPTIANDLLQAEWNHAIKDTWRFIVNSTFGLGGVLDVASGNFRLPPHSNDLGLTLAKWGNKQSPFIMLPLLGPTTIRDGMGMVFDYAFFTPYPYLRSDALLYSLLTLRYVDLRGQMLDTERLMDNALDRYAFMRDAYLQHRTYLITGEQEDIGSLYIAE